MTAQQADYLMVPLLDGRFGVVQVTEVAPDDTLYCALSSQTCADNTVPVSPLALGDVTGFVRLPADTLATTGWAINGFDQLPVFQDINLGWARQHPDMATRDTAVIEGFLNAWHGLYPWDTFGDLFETIKRPQIDRPV